METLPLYTPIELDKPSEEDYNYHGLFGASEDLPKSFQFLPKKIFNQGAKKKTYMACSRYGAIHAINAQNLAVAKIDGMRTFQFNPEVSWLARIQDNPQAEFEGDTLQSALDQMKKLRLITGYSRLYGIEQMKRSLVNYRPIYTGSKQCDWTRVRDRKVYAVKAGYGHIFCVVGYNEEGFIAINSYGAKNGVFLIPYDLVGTLFSTYALHDTRDEECLKNK